MIKYKIWYKEIDGSERDFGIIKGYNKRDLAFQLNKIKKMYNLDIKNIRLENLEYKIDNKENL